MDLFKVTKNPPRKILLLKKSFLVLTVVFSSVIATKAPAAQATSAPSCENVFIITSKHDMLGATSESVKQGIFGKLKSVFGRSNEIPASLAQKKLTTVRLSGEQPVQRNSIQENLKQVQQVVNYANSKLLTEFTPPEEIFASFDENKHINSASISYYELDLGKKEPSYSTLGYLKDFLHGSAKKEAIPIITHEYFHLILNQAVADISPELKSRMEKSLVESRAERIEHKNNELELRASRLEHQAKTARFLVDYLQGLKARKQGAYTREQIKILENWLKSINRNDLFADIEFTEQNVDETINLFEKFRSDSSIQAQKLEQLRANLESPKPTKLPTEDQSQMAHIRSFYSSAIHELFADLGAVLLTEDPSIVGKQLNSPYRDFNRNLTLDEASKEFSKSTELLIAYTLQKAREKGALSSPSTPEGTVKIPEQPQSLYAVHPFFFYQRNLLWRNYFSKTPKQQWPKLLKSLADAFANEIVNNPKDIYDVVQATGETIVNFDLANQHLENVIRRALSRP